MDTENIRLKFRYYLIPQALVSLFIGCYPYFLGSLFRWLYTVTKLPFLNHNVLLQFLSVLFCTFALSYFSYARKGILLFHFSYKKWGRRSAFFMLPLFTGLFCAVGMQMHIDNAKIKNYTISNINQLRNIPDSTETYTIEYYHILYDEYVYSESFDDVKAGSSKKAKHVTEVNTYAVYPVLVNSSAVYDIKKQTVWIGFHVSKRLDESYSFDDPIATAAAYENLTKIHAQDNIVYFTETTDDHYLNLIRQKSVNDFEPIILEAHYSTFVPYNGYRYALNTLYFYLIANVFLILVALTIDLDEGKKNVLKKLH